MTIKIQQCDRNAAAHLLGYRDWAEATDYRTSARDDQKRELVVQAFAKHRIEALALAMEIVEFERVDASQTDSEEDRAYNRAIDHVQDAIRNAAHKGGKYE